MPSHFSPSLSADKPAALRPIRLKTVTPAEQIARHLGQAILEGKFGPGDRIGEQAVADLFAVSRGPVREALRELHKQGLVEISPRRGAFVVNLVLDDVVDIFNIRGAMMGLAARYLAVHPDPVAFEQLDARLAELRERTEAEDTPLVEFVKAVGRMGTGVIQHCGNRQLASTYRNLPHDAVWQMLWVDNKPLDYDRRERRLESLHGYERLLAALRAGDARAAEDEMRRIVRESCQEVIGRMRLARAQTADDFRLHVL